MSVDKATLRPNLSDSKLPTIEAPVISQKILEDLKVPKEVQDAILKDPRVFHTFFAREHGRLTAITDQPEIKALSTDFPPPDTDPNALMPVVPQGGSGLVGMASEEQTDFHDWLKEKMGKLVKGQGDKETKQLVNEVKDYINQLMDDNPELKDELDLNQEPKDDTVAQTVTLDKGVEDIMTNLVKADLQFEDPKQEEAYQKLIMLLASKGDTDGLSIAIGMKATRIVEQRLGKALAAYRDVINTRGQVIAQAELLAGKQDIASTAKFNAQVGQIALQGQSIMMAINQLLAKRDTIQSMTHGLLRSGDEFDRTVHSNLRTG